MTLKTKPSAVIERTSPPTTFNVAIITSEVARRMRARLLSGTTGTRVVWQKDRQQLLIHADSLAARSLEGWLLVNLDVETDQTGRQLLQFVFYVGKSGENDAHQAACTINAGTELASQLVDPWGRDLQRVLWDAVLDAIELSVERVSAQNNGSAVTLGGFYCHAQAFHVSIILGDI